MTNKTIIVSGDILSARIRENGFKKKEVAKATGISESRLCNICKPGNHRLMSSTLKKLANCLGCKEESFLAEENIPALSDDENEIFQMFRQLDVVSKANVIQEIKKHLDSMDRKKKK